MAKIRVIKVKGRKSKVKPKVVYLHNSNFDKATTKRNNKYNVVTVGTKQKERYIANQMKAYSDTFRFHKTGTSVYSV